MRASRGTQHRGRGPEGRRVISAIYPEANTFHSYNAVSELDDPDEVLRFVIGCAKGRELIDRSPVVMWRLREESPAEWLSTPIST
jgi:hypothetical protein